MAGLRGFSAYLTTEKLHGTFHHGQKQKRIVFQFLLLIWRLQFLGRLFSGVTSQAVLCGLSPSVLEGGADLVTSHIAVNQGYCEREIKRGSSLDSWTPSSENLIVFPAELVKENDVWRVKNGLFHVTFPALQTESPSCSSFKGSSGSFGS